MLSGADVLAALLPALAEALASGGLASDAASWGCVNFLTIRGLQCFPPA